MKFIGNLLWLLLGGFIIAMWYFIVGVLFCITIVGIPFGLQLFKFGKFTLWPFGKEAKLRNGSMGFISIIMNIIWLCLGGLGVTAAHLSMGLVFCVTIIGIPFGIQHFKLALLALIPFGHEVR